MKKTNLTDYTIRRAVPADVETILLLADASRQTMRHTGNPTQWPDDYPSRDVVDDDLRRGDCYLVCADEGRIVGSFVFREGPDLSYAHIYNGAWTDDEQPYHVVHRVTSLPDWHGVFATIIDFCFRHAANIRIDTHRNNHIMQHLITKYGFRYCGVIHLIDKSVDEERLAYQWMER